MTDTLDTRGAAELLHVSETTLLALARCGKIPGTQLFGHWLFIREDLLDAVRQAAADEQRYRREQAEAMASWQPVETAPTDTPLLACYLDAAGKPKVIRAELISGYTQEAGQEWDCTEYDEATDTYYRAPGWVELMDHWDDHYGCYIHATIIGWMPLPQPMETPA